MTNNLDKSFKNVCGTESRWYLVDAGVWLSRKVELFQDKDFGKNVEKQNIPGLEFLGLLTE